MSTKKERSIKEAFMAACINQLQTIQSLDVGGTIYTLTTTQADASTMVVKAKGQGDVYSLHFIHIKLSIPWS